MSPNCIKVEGTKKAKNASPMSAIQGCSEPDLASACDHRCLGVSDQDIIRIEDVVQMVTWSEKNT